MTDNRFAYWTTAYGFAYCKNALAVLDEYARHFHVGCSDSDLKAMRDDALARIRELTPPPEKPVVSEEARERAATLLAKIMADCALSRRNPDAVDTALDRIIDALGYTEAAEPDVVPIERVITTGRCPREGCGGTPAVDLTPSQLRAAAAMVEAFEGVYKRTFMACDDGIDISEAWTTTIAGRPMTVIRRDADDWVLRIGGEQ